jgi:hypothetical protein
LFGNGGRGGDAFVGDAGKGGKGGVLLGVNGDDGYRP